MRVNGVHVPELDKSSASASCSTIAIAAAALTALVSHTTDCFLGFAPELKKGRRLDIADNERVS
jgi:hypothetical protein